MPGPFPTGVYTALVTPFVDDQIDETALRQLVERQIKGGVAGLVPCGTTGENVTLRADEPSRVIRIVVEAAAGRVPVIAGSGTVSTAHTIGLSAAAKEAGADGLLLVCPYYNRPTQDGLVAHFQAVLKAVPMPTMLYNIPGRTGVDLKVASLKRLAVNPNIVAVKEATGTVTRSQEILSSLGDRLQVFSGDDALSLPIAAVGGAGVVSVASNLLPQQVSAVMSALQDGDLPRARALHFHLLPLYRVLFRESNPGPIKYLMAKADMLAPGVRLPLVWPTEETREVLDMTMRGLEVAS